MIKDDRIHNLRTLRSTPRHEATPETFVRSVRHRMGGAFDLPKGLAAETVTAEVNPTQHLRPGNWIARWIVRCPDCGGAEDVDPAEPVFFCCSCFNESAGGQWRSVIFPAEGERIEALLMARPHARLRGAAPGQTPSDLEAENRAIERASGGLDWREPEAAARLLHERLNAGAGRAR